MSAEEIVKKRLSTLGLFRWKTLMAQINNLDEQKIDLQNKLFALTKKHNGLMRQMEKLWLQENNGRTIKQGEK